MTLVCEVFDKISKAKNQKFSIRFEQGHYSNAMTKTMRGDKKNFKWIHGEDKSFEALKHKVAKLPILALPNFNKVFQEECDASGSAIGAVLSEEGKPFSFFSEKLNITKRKYCV